MALPLGLAIGTVLGLAAAILTAVGDGQPGDRPRAATRSDGPAAARSPDEPTALPPLDLAAIADLDRATWGKADPDGGDGGEGAADADPLALLGARAPTEAAPDDRDLGDTLAAIAQEIQQPPDPEGDRPAPSPEPSPEPTPAPAPAPAAPLPVPSLSLSSQLQAGNLSRRDYEDRPNGWPIDTLVLHHTGVSRSVPPSRIADNWQSDPAETSAHFIIGADGSIVQAVPPSKTAFHILKQATYPDPRTGEPLGWINLRSIGLEFHYRPDRERPTRDQIVSGGRLIGALFNRYPDLEVDRIIGHGVQAFADHSRGRSLSEPTHLFMQPGGRIDPNFLLLLYSAAEVSPEIAGAARAAGGWPQLAARIQRQTLAGRQITQRLPSNWTQESGMSVSPITPQAALAELQGLAAGFAPPRATASDSGP